MLTHVQFMGEGRKRVLITGATGAIGKELTRFLQAQPNQDVITLSTGSHSRINIQDKKRIDKLLEQNPVDTIYHLAALNPFKSNRGADYFDTNVQGAENLLYSVLQLKKQGKKVPKVFLASSALAYTPEKIHIPSLDVTSPIKEEALDRTLEAAAQRVPAEAVTQGEVSQNLLRQFYLSKDEIYYNDSKLLAEMTARTYAKAGVPVKVGRLVNCYGKNANQLMNQLLAEVQSGQTPTLAGKDAKARDYLFFDSKQPQDDLLRSIQAIAEKGRNGEAYNVSSAGRFVRSPQAILNLVQHHGSSRNTALQAQTEPARNNPYAILSNQKLLALGVETPRTSPETGIKILCKHPSKSASARLFNRFLEKLSKSWQALKNFFAKLLGFNAIKAS